MTPKRSNIYMLALIIYQLTLTFAISVVFIFFKIDVNMPLYIISTQLASFIVPFLLFLLITKRKITDVLQLNKISIVNLVLIFFIILLFEPLMSFLSAITTIFFNNDVADLITNLYSYPLWLVFITLAVTPSICEEITMRGVIFSGYKDMPLLKGALVNGLFFGIMHLNAQQFLYAFFLGAVFYYLVYYTNSIFASIFAHFCVNGTQTLMAYFSLRLMEFQSELQGAEILEEYISSQNINETVLILVSTGFIAAVTAPFAFGLLYFFICYNKKRNNQYVPKEITLPNESKAIDAFAIIVIVVYLVFVIFEQVAVRFLS